MLFQFYMVDNNLFIIKFLGQYGCLFCLSVDISYYIIFLYNFTSLQKNKDHKKYRNHL